MGEREKNPTLLSLLTKWDLITLPNRLVNHKARSSFIGSKLASCLLASHWLYWCISERPGPLRTFGLRAVHIIYPLVIPVLETKEQLLFIQISLVKILMPMTKVRNRIHGDWWKVRLLIIKPQETLFALSFLVLSLLTSHLVENSSNQRSNRNIKQ